jgi:chitinase
VQYLVQSLESVSRCEVTFPFPEFELKNLRPPDFYYLEGFDPISMECHVDFFNFMAYDLHGPWEASDQGAFVRPQSSTLDIDNDLLPLWFDGLNSSKINLGIPYYGRGYTLSSNYCTDIGCSYSGPSLPGPCTGSPGVLSLREIKQIIKEKKLTPKLITDAKVKQITWDNQWVGYDDHDTIKMKVKWADEHCLGGTAVWSIDFDSGAGR